jgi:ERCC4-type nuclease
VDTREQSPWTFSGIRHDKQLLLARRERMTLATGDYTISGYEDRLCIERKSAADFVQSVTREATRFKAEHERMAALAQSAPGSLACVIVEGSLASICDELEAEAGRRVTPDMILGAVAAWPARYGVHWWFAGDRRHAELLAWRVMWRWWCEWTKREVKR